MQWIASGFLFVRGTTIIHRLDPRIRLSIALALFFVALLSRSIIELLVFLGISFAIVATAKISYRFAKSMLVTGVISAIAFLLNFFVSGAGWHTSIVFGLRLFTVISATSVFFLTTTPDELEQVMRWLKFPTDFVMVFVIAVRFVPVLLLDSLQIMDAQRSRGLEFDKGSLIQRLRNTIPIIVPLIAVALNRSLDLAEAMDSRAYGATPKPTSLYRLKLSNLDFIAISLIAACLVVGSYVAFLVPLF